MRLTDVASTRSVAGRLRLLLASVCLILILAGRPAAGVGIEFWHDRSYRTRAVLRVKKVVGATEAYAVIHTRLDPARGTPGLLVVDAAGTKVPFKVVAAGPGDRFVVAFRMTQLFGYHIYFNPAADAPADPSPGLEWEPGSGVLLRTFKWGLDRPDLNTLDGFQALVRASTTSYGGGYREAIFQGPNPYGPSERYVSAFVAYLRIEQAGRYELATNSDDASALYVNGTLVAQYLGRHGARATRGEKSGAIRLESGVHRIDYLHAEDRSGQACVAGWRPPGDKHFSLIPPEAFVPIVHARVLRYEQPSGALPNFRWRVKSVYTNPSGTMALIGVTFNAVPTGVLWPEAYRWSLGDGETGTGKSVEHVYLTQGIVPVSLEVLDKRGPPRTVRHWVGVWHLEERNTQGPAKTRAAFERLLEGYVLDARPTAALETLHAFYKPNAAMDARRMRVCRELVSRLKETDVPKALGYSLELAELHERLDRWRTAEVRKEIYNSILELAQSGAQKARAHLKLGELLLTHEHNPAEAIEHFRAVGKLAAPRDVRRLALIRIGDAELEAGNLDAARLAYRAVPVRAADRQHAVVLSEAYGLSVERSLAEGNADQALETINAWERRLPEAKLAGYSLLLRVRVAVEQERADEAKRYGRLIIDVLEADAHKPEAYATLIRLLLEEDNRAEAAERYRELRDRFPLSDQARELAPLFGH